jgi:hypothetical protein
MTISNARSLVRPVCTIALTVALVVGFFVGKVSSEQFYTLASAVLLWWFADRATNPRP